jgi:putative pyoverdin transport system ATP-binding/permease protein
MGLELIQFLLHIPANSGVRRSILIVAVVASLISGATSVALVMLVNRSLLNADQGTEIFFWIFLAVCIASMASRILSEALLIRFAQRLALSLRMLLSRQILSASQRDIERFGAHRLLVLLTDDILVIANIVPLVPRQLINAVIVIGSMVYLGILSRIGLLLVLAVLIAGSFAYRKSAGPAKDRMMLARQDQDMLFRQFRSLTEGAKELKLHRQRREAFLEQRLCAVARTLSDHLVEAQTSYRVAGSWAQSLEFMLMATFLFVAPVRHLFHTPVLVSFVLTILYIMGPLSALLTVVPTFGRADIAARKIEQFRHELKPESTTPAAIVTEPRYLPGPLQLVNVTHKYRNADAEFILGPVDLSIHPGEMVFLVGGNGSGKTTLAKIIVGLYRPESGDIRMAGESLSAGTLEQYRQHFSAIFSDFHLFESCLGLQEEDLDARADKYLVALQLKDKVRVVDGIFSTTDLSQGQRKRLALLIAYLEDRPFYVFDEWAADQDPHFREVFYKELLPELQRRGKTILVISHDDRYYGLADRIIKMEYGQIAEDNCLLETMVHAGTGNRDYLPA